VEHDNMNVIVFGSRVIASHLAEDLVESLFACDVHQRRTPRPAVAKIEKLEEKF
jgi:ribose 5-phosphate isomerase RpiB